MPVKPKIAGNALCSAGQLASAPRAMAGMLACALVSVSLAWGFYSTDASANIYSFKDENGITHFSNLPHLDRRYKLVYRIPVAGQYRPNAWSASGPTAVDISRLVPLINDAARAVR